MILRPTNPFLATLLERVNKHFFKGNFRNIFYFILLVIICCEVGENGLKRAFKIN